jgi:hypothetical protein
MAPKNEKSLRGTLAAAKTQSTKVKKTRGTHGSGKSQVGLPNLPLTVLRTDTCAEMPNRFSARAKIRKLFRTRRPILKKTGSFEQQQPRIESSYLRLISRS